MYSQNEMAHLFLLQKEELRRENVKINYKYAGSA